MVPKCKVRALRLSTGDMGGRTGSGGPLWKRGYLRREVKWWGGAVEA